MGVAGEEKGFQKAISHIRDYSSQLKTNWSKWVVVLINFWKFIKSWKWGGCWPNPSVNLLINCAGFLKTKEKPLESF